jgi:hypothetical protein
MLCVAQDIGEPSVQRKRERRPGFYTQPVVDGAIPQGGSGRMGQAADGEGGVTEPTEILRPFGEYLTPGPSTPCIALLRDALEMAERGEVVGVAIAMISPVGFVRTRGEKGSRGMAEMVGAVAVMQDDLIRRWKDE